MTARLVVTTSWDDGHPLDMKLAELLTKYGVAGTFYIPERNVEGRPVLKNEEIRQLAAKFEVGGHSIDHVVLTQLDHSEAKRQIAEGKRWLEGVIGKPVPGFAYVRGRYNTAVKELVRQAGFEYARTVENLRDAAGDDPYEMPTTVQLRDHQRQIYVRNFLRNPRVTRLRLLREALASANLVDRVERLIAASRRAGGVFHLWGHSWEIEEHGLWRDLEAVLAHLSAASQSTSFATNHEVHRLRHAAQRAAA